MIEIRPAVAQDAPAIAALYAHHVVHGTGTFEEVPPNAAEMARRMADVQARSLPYFVAIRDGEIVGFAYAAPFRLRSAYRYTAEDSVYIAQDFIGQGVGKALLTQVIAACEALGIRQLMGVIGDSANAGSIGLHQSLGFEVTGSALGVGFKHGRFVDIVFMQKALNSDRPEPSGGLAL